MKIFASVAILAASVAAVNTQAASTAGVEDTYSDLFQSKHLSHHHNHPVVHVDIWQKIADELMELMTEVTDLTNSASSQQNMIDQVEGSFGTLMTSIADLRDGNTANSVALAQQKAIDASQDKRLEQMVDDVTGLEHKVSALASKVNILGLTIGDLPDFASLGARITAITEENERLEGEANANKTELEDLATRITTANDDLDEINGTSGLVPTASTNL